jgi:hypothetical protein
MTIGPRASSSATATSSSAVTTQAITIPAAVAFADVVLIEAVCLPVTTTTPPVITVQSSTGTTPQAFGTPATGSEPLPASVSGTPFRFVASTSDAGKVITFQSTIAGFWAISLFGYTGVHSSTIISVVSSPAFGGANTATVTLPQVTATCAAGSLLVYMGGGAAEGGSLTSPAGSTTRAAIVSSANVASVIADGNAVVNQGSQAGGGQFTTGTAANSILVGHTVLLAASPVPEFLAVPAGVDGNGMASWSFTSTINGPGTQTLRILPPASPAAGFAHAFLYMLPVVIGTATTNGDPISVAESLAIHNTYNLTCVVPSYAIDPWFSDNPNNAAQQQETFMLHLAQWMASSQYATTGIEKNYLIGFSKSGIGGQGLIFHRPDVWAKCASWDAPFCMTASDGTDPTFGSQVGGNPANAYGTDANFQANYRLFGNGNIATWNAAAANTFSSTKRLWIGGFFSFQADVAAYKAALTSGGIIHDEWNSLASAHQWENPWVADALRSMLVPPSGGAILGAAGII